jgi:hypothetical protein
MSLLRLVSFRTENHLINVNLPGALPKKALVICFGVGNVFGVLTAAPLSFELG